VNEKNRASIAVVHLARYANGLMPLERFLKSYLDYPAGMAHELVIVLKGYDTDPVAEQAARRLIAPYAPKTLTISDVGLDLDAYRAAADAFHYSYYFFLNSFSCITSERWLQKMMHLATRPEVGIVGVTGSYQSAFTDETDFLIRAIVGHIAKLRFGIGSDAILKPDKSSRTDSSSGSEPRVQLASRLSRVLLFYAQAVCRALRAFHYFPMFPNHHVRTNGFLLSRRVLNEIRWQHTSTKFDAYCLESGRRSLTAQVIQLGLEPMIVGRNGRGYFRKQWHLSRSFWHGDQENLLMEDNQTRQYKEGTLDERKRLSWHAWRKLASPDYGTG